MRLGAICRGLLIFLMGCDRIEKDYWKGRNLQCSLRTVSAFDVLVKYEFYGARGE